MRLDEFLAMHDRLVMDESVAILNPPERRESDSDAPPKIERRKGILSDLRPRPKTLAGMRWLEENRRWEAAHAEFKKQGKPIDEVLRAWCASSGLFEKIQATLMGRIISLTSESAALVSLVNHLVELEKKEHDIRPSLTDRLWAKAACKRAGAEWMQIGKIVDVETVWSDERRNE